MTAVPAAPASRPRTTAPIGVGRERISPSATRGRRRAPVILGSVAQIDADTVEDVVVVAGRDLAITRPANTETLLDGAAFEHEEFLPYWAGLGRRALALGRRVGTRALRGARVLELGCGLGLPSIAAALAGGRVLATDWSPAAIDFTEHNA